MNASSEPEQPRSLKRKARTTARPKKRQATHITVIPDVVGLDDAPQTKPKRRKVNVTKTSKTQTDGAKHKNNNLKAGDQTFKATKTGSGRKQAPLTNANTGKEPKNNAGASKHAVVTNAKTGNNTKYASAKTNKTENANHATANELVHTKWFRAMARKLSYMLVGGALVGSAAYKAAALWGYVKASEAAKQVAAVAEKQELYKQARAFMDMASSGGMPEPELGMSLASQDPKLAFEKGRRFLNAAQAHTAGTTPVPDALTRYQRGLQFLSMAQAQGAAGPMTNAAQTPATSLFGSFWRSGVTRKQARNAAIKSSSLVATLMPTASSLRSENLATVAKWVALVITMVLSMRWLGTQLWKLTWGHGASDMKQEAEEHHAFVHGSRQQLQRASGAAHEAAHTADAIAANAQQELANLMRKQNDLLRKPLVPLRQVFAGKKQTDTKNAAETAETPRVAHEAAHNWAPELVRRARQVFNNNTNARIQRLTSKKKAAPERVDSDSNGEDLYSFWPTPP